MAKKAAKPKEETAVPKYRQCPVCYTGDGGVGDAYCTRGNTRYYKCKECSHTWTAIVKTEVRRVTNRTVELEER